jgi:hypothetical protein
VAGADGNIRLNKSTLLEFHSLVSATDDSIAGTDSRAGMATTIYLHSEKRDLLYGLSVKDISGNFITRTGFVQRSGITMITGRIVPRLYPESKFFRRIDLELFSAQTRDNIFDKWETNNSFTAVNVLGGSFKTFMKFSLSTEIYQNRRFNTSGFQPIITGNIGTKLTIVAAYRWRNGIYYPASEQGFGESFVGDIRFLPYEKLHTQFTVTYQDLFRKSDKEKLYDYLIARGLINIQFNKYLFIRTIMEYNTYRNSLTTDFLVSFTYVPGTVFHVGYGNLFEHKKWDGTDYVDDNRLMEMKRGAFVKLSYLFRL